MFERRGILFFFTCSNYCVPLFRLSHCNISFSSRSLVDCALGVYVNKGLSVKNPVQCLDLSVEKQEGDKWKKTHGYSVNLIETDLNITNGCNSTDKDGCEISSRESGYTVIEKTDFNFM